MMGELKLYGMKSAYDETLATLKRKHEPQHFVGDLLKAEISEKQARSIKYQLDASKNLAESRVFFCGCRPWCKKFLIRCASDRVRSSVRPVKCGIREAAGRHGDLRTRAKTDSRAQGLIENDWLSGSRSVRSFCPYGSSPSFTPFIRRQVDFVARR
jgi:hypothetical protein